MEFIPAIKKNDDWRMVYDIVLTTWFADLWSLIGTRKKTELGTGDAAQLKNSVN